MRSWLVASALLLAALACNLTGGDDQSAQTPATAIPFPTQPFILPTATLLPTFVPTPALTAPSSISCAPVTTWPIYTVQVGDTLGAIADATGVTVEQLVSANCLASADVIYVGQQLYVPVLPPPLAPAATSDPLAPIFSQGLTIEKHWINPEGRAITYYSTVRLNLGVAQNADRVNFYVNDPSGTSAILIGQDLNPSDGAFWDYSFPAPGEYTFMATAENVNQSINSNVFTVRYDPNYVPPEGRLTALITAPRRAFASQPARIAGQN
jgi:hypothetical protein